MYDDHQDGDPSPALHTPAAKEVDHFLSLLDGLLTVASREDLDQFLAMNGPSPSQHSTQQERPFRPPAPDAPARILGNLEAFRRAFPGIVARPDLFLSNVSSIVLMAAMEVVWRANESGQLEQAIAFGTWLRESV